MTTQQSDKVMLLEVAQQAACRLVDLLRPFCDQVEIAGSIRRQRPYCRDIDLVLLPKRTSAGKLTPLFLDFLRRSDKWTLPEAMDPPKAPKLTPDSKTVQLHSRARSGFKAELWLATDDNFGWIHHLRTGDEDWTTALVNVVQPWGFRFQKGRLWRTNSAEDPKFWTAIPTPTEAAMFETLELELPKPWLRLPSRLPALISERASRRKAASEPRPE